MPNVAVLPTPLARAALAATNPRNAATCGIYDIAGRLGQAHRNPKYICTTLDTLIRDASFPAPFPLVKAGKLAKQVHRDSRWNRATVEIWFDGHLPPEARAHVAVAERVEVDSRLNTNLSRLFEDRVA